MKLTVCCRKLEVRYHFPLVVEPTWAIWAIKVGHKKVFLKNLKNKLLRCHVAPNKHVVQRKYRQKWADDALACLYDTDSPSKANA